MEVTWSGRAYVDESKLTEAQYNTFFERGAYGIKLDIANTILANKGDEVVPCDELDYDSRAQIKEAIIRGETYGTLYSDGQSLDWAWMPELTSEGDEVSLSDLDEFALRHIASQMLDDECRWGIIEV